MKTNFFFLAFFIVAANVATGQQCTTLLQTNPPPTINVCNGGTLSITLGAASGGDNTFAYRWQSSPDNTTWSDIAGASSENYINASPTSGTYYRRRVISCSTTPDTIYSTIVVVTVLNKLAASISPAYADTTICYNTQPAAFTVSVTTPEGGNSHTLKWESLVGSGNWTFVAGNVATYQPPALTGNINYHCVIMSGNGCDTIYLGAMINVYPIFSAGKITTATTTVCPLATGITITSTNDAAGGNGAITYQWRMDNTLIPSENANNLTIPNTLLTSGTHRFVRDAQDVLCSGGWKPSDTVTITVPSALDAGEIQSGSETVCFNGTATTIGSITPASAGATYSWVVNGTGVIPSATGATYTPPTNTAGTSIYTRVAKNTCDSIVSVGSWTLTVLPKVDPQSIPSKDDTICYRGTPPTITGTAATGGDVLTYRWKKIANGDTTIISNSNVSDFTPTDTTTSGTFTYYREVSSNYCNEWVRSTGEYTLTVLEKINAGAIKSDGEIVCHGNAPTITINEESPASEGDGNYTYQWLRNDIAIAGIADSFYLPEDTAVGDYVYVRQVQDRTCGIWETSDGEWKVVVMSVPDSIQIGGGKTVVCQGEVTNYFVTSANVREYIWELSSDCGTFEGNTDTSDVFIRWNDDFTGSCNLNLQVRVVFRCGDTVLSNIVPITVNETPKIEFINHPKVVCSGTDYVYSVTEITRASYTWVVDGGDVVDGWGMHSVKIKWEDASNMGVVTAEARLDGCSSDVRDTVSIGASTVVDLNKIIAKTDKTGVPYMLIYPNPAGRFAYQWYKNDTAVSNAVEQYFYPPNYGQVLDKTAKYKVYVIDLYDLVCGGNFTDEFDFSTVKRLESDNYFSISPNPVTGGYFTVSFNRALIGDVSPVRLSIYSMVGEKVWEQPLSTLDDVRILTTMPSGVYTLVLTTPKQQYVEKLTVNR